MNPVIFNVSDHVASVTINRPEDSMPLMKKQLFNWKTFGAK